MLAELYTLCMVNVTSVSIALEEHIDGWCGVILVVFFPFRTHGKL